MSTAEIRNVQTNVPTPGQMVKWNFEWALNLGLYGFKKTFNAQEFPLHDFLIDPNAKAGPALTLRSALNNLVEEWELEGAQEEAWTRYPLIRQQALDLVSTSLKNHFGNDGTDVDGEQSTRDIMVHWIAKGFQLDYEMRHPPPPESVKLGLLTEPCHRPLRHPENCTNMQAVWIPVNAIWDEARAMLLSRCSRFDGYGNLEPTVRTNSWSYCWYLESDTWLPINTSKDYRVMMDQVKRIKEIKVTVILTMDTLESRWVEDQEEFPDDGSDLEMVDPEGHPLVTPVDWTALIQREIDAPQTEEVNAEASASPKSTASVSNQQLALAHNPQPPPARSLLPTQQTLTPSTFPGLFPQRYAWNQIDARIPDSYHYPNVQRNPNQDVVRGALTVFRPSSIHREELPTRISPVASQESVCPLQIITPARAPPQTQPQALPQAPIRQLTEGPCQPPLPATLTQAQASPVQVPSQASTGGQIQDTVQASAQEHITAVSVQQTDPCVRTESRYNLRPRRRSSRRFE